MDLLRFDLARELVDPPEWECPGISPHAVHEFTCTCSAVYYELLSHGRPCLIHKVVQLDTPQHAFAGAWPHFEARRWWLLLILGDAIGGHFSGRYHGDRWQGPTYTRW